MFWVEFRFERAVKLDEENRARITEQERVTKYNTVLADIAEVNVANARENVESKKKKKKKKRE